MPDAGIGKQLLRRQGIVRARLAVVGSIMISRCGLQCVYISILCGSFLPHAVIEKRAGNQSTLLYGAAMIVT